LLRHIYKQHPPRNPAHVMLDPLDTASIRKAVQTAITHYHPDRDEPDDGVDLKWRLLSAEISMHLAIRCSIEARSGVFVDSAMEAKLELLSQKSVDSAVFLRFLYSEYPPANKEHELSHPLNTDHIPEALTEAFFHYRSPQVKLSHLENVEIVMHLSSRLSYHTNQWMKSRGKELYDECEHLLEAMAPKCSSTLEFLRFIYEKHPPKCPYHVTPLYGQNVSLALDEALTHYTYQEKNICASRRKWKALKTEITKLLNNHDPRRT
jgi:hypothetical protein